MTRCCSSTTLALFLTLGLVGCSGDSAPTVSTDHRPSPPSVSGGRILLGIEHGDSHTMAYIDATGMHAISSTPDSTMSQWAWGGGDAVVFTREDDGVRHAYRMTIGGDPVPVGPSGSAQENPHVSPDGSQVVYEQYDPATNRDLGLHLANIDGSNPRRITPAAPVGATWGYAEPSFSPDGRWVTFARVTDWEQGRAAIFVVRTDGTGLRQLTGYGLDAGSPRWSPDGKTILFTQGLHSGPSDGLVGPLWTVGAGGGRPAALTHDPRGWSFDGAWSPDGAEIVYQYHRPGWDHNQLRIVSADGSDDRLLWTSPSGSTAETPDWAP